MRKVLLVLFGLSLVLSLKAQSGGFYLKTGRLFDKTSRMNTIGAGARTGIFESGFRLDFGLSSTFSFPLIKISSVSNEMAYVHGHLGYDVLKSEKFEFSPFIGILIRSELMKERIGYYTGYIYGFHFQAALNEHIALCSMFQVGHSHGKDLPGFSLGFIFR